MINYYIVCLIYYRIQNTQLYVSMIRRFFSIISTSYDLYALESVEFFGILEQQTCIQSHIKILILHRRVLSSAIFPHHITNPCHFSYFQMFNW